MDEVLLWLGRLLGMIGALVCVAALVNRFSGEYLLGGFQVGTVFLGGTAAMVAGCLCLLLRLDWRR